MTDIATYQTANTKASDSLENSPTFIDQLSPPSFWDSFDNQTITNTNTTTNNNNNTSVSPSLLGSPRTTLASQPQSAITSLSGGSDPVRNLKSRNERTPKRPSAKKRKCSETKQRDLSALDCSDYWLRFDSDSESLYHAGAEHSRDKSEPRLFDWIQPYSRASSVGTTGTFNVAFQSSEENSIDDSALEHALSDEEELFSMAFADGLKTESPTSAIEAPERLYSTPLSWERPQPGLQQMEQMDPYLPPNAQYQDPERQRLLAIALGSGQTPPQHHQQQQQQQQHQGINPSSAMDFRFDMNPSPNAQFERTSEPEIKRPIPKPRAPPRANPPPATDKPKDKPKSSDRAAHNDIERKYRTNLKDRISELREAIPSLRAIPDDGDDMASARAAPKVSKGTVLSKATEYIHTLERRNRAMAIKNEELSRRLQAFEQLIGSGAVGPGWQPPGFGPAVFNPRPFP